MTVQKDLKRRVRARMLKTGESYTTARSKLLDHFHKATDNAPKAATPQGEEPDNAQLGRVADFAKLAGMSDTAVHAKTGRTWAAWTDVLDREGAAQMAHRDIAKLVTKRFGIPGWWAQTITVGYERIRGLREIGQRREGSYEANKSRTFPVDVATLFAAFTHAPLRRRWLAGAKPAIRKATDGKTVRMVWEDGTRVEVYFVSKGAKTQVAIQHRKLAARSDIEVRKAYWQERLDDLAALLAARR